MLHCRICCAFLWGDGSVVKDKDCGLWCVCAVPREQEETWLAKCRIVDRKPISDWSKVQLTLGVVLWNCVIYSKFLLVLFFVASFNHHRNSKTANDKRQTRHIMPGIQSEARQVKPASQLDCKAAAKEKTKAKAKEDPKSQKERKNIHSEDCWKHTCLEKLYKLRDQIDDVAAIQLN